MTTFSERADRVDYFSATANCQVTMPLNVGRSAAVIDFAVAAEQADSRVTTIDVTFPSAARGCASVLSYDPDRDRNVYQLTSLMTLFHSDDTRPAWMRAVQGLMGDRLPAELPRPVSSFARQLLLNYGPGSITVLQDASRPVVGEVIAGETGPAGNMFPAHSYFDQYLVVKVGGRTFTNKTPLRVSATVNQWPPAGETYRSEHITNFFDVSDLDGPPAFAFGKCTIVIGSALGQDDVNGMEDVIRSLRG